MVSPKVLDGWGSKIRLRCTYPWPPIHLDYCMGFWRSYSSVGNSFRIQRNVLRFLEGVLPRTHFKLLFIEHQIMRLSCIFFLVSLINVHCSLSDYATYMEIKDYITRFADLLFIPRSRITTTKNNKFDVTIYHT